MEALEDLVTASLAFSTTLLLLARIILQNIRLVAGLLSPFNDNTDWCIQEWRGAWVRPNQGRSLALPEE